MGLLIYPSPFYTYLNFKKGEGGSKGAIVSTCFFFFLSFSFLYCICTSRDPVWLLKAVSLISACSRLFLAEEES